MAGGSYTVRRGDTLSSIATQAYAGSERGALARQLVAIYRANSSAFQGNMNVLRSGARLTLPGDAEVAAIGPGEASAEVRQQYAAWNSARVAGSGTGNSGQLRLVPPQDGAQAPASAAAGPQPGGAQAAGGGNSAALTQKVQQLQSQLQDSQRQLSESQRLLQMRNEELAALQARIAQSATNPAPAASGKPAAPVAVTPPPPPAPVNPPAAISAPPSSASSPTAVPAPSETATPSTPPPPPPKAAASKPKVTPAAAGESGNSMLDLIEEYWYVPAGLLAVLIALLVLRYVRSRQEDEFDRSLGRLQPSFEPASSTTLRTGADTIPVRALAASREPSYRVEESGSHEAPVFDDAPEHVSTVATGEHVAMDETHAGPAVALDQGDPLAEADFHMAYGLYDQAADLVQIAIAREPGRRDLRLKLLEVFFVWGNKDRFLQSARELSASRSAALPGEWEKIVIMGRQIAPEDPLFANTGALTGAAIGGVDLNLEGGQNRVDFDLLGEPSVSGAVDLDLGAALGDTDPTGEARKIGDSGVDFVLDDPQRGNDATGSTREMLGATSATTVSSKARAGGGATATMKIANGGGESELPTVEQPQLRGLDNPTIRQKIDAARTGLAAGEQTAELALDDLGLDLGTLEAGADDAVMPGGADAPTMLAGVDEDTRRILARAEAERAQAERAEVERAEAARADAERAQAERVAAEGVVAERAAAERAAHAKTQKSPGLAPTSTGTWLFSDSDFASVVPGAKPASNGRAAADAPTELVTQIATQQITATPELDTGSTSRMAKIDTSDLDLDFADLNDEQAVNGIDLDVGVASAGEGTFVQTQKIAPDEMPLPDLEPATMSEVGTKLDLARAYMDMGDPEGARSILGEVLSEGSVSQKQEARRLMDTLPG